MEQAQGSVFVAARSFADFQWSDVVKNARTVIAHRSNPCSDLTGGIATSRWSGHASFDRVVCSLPDNESFVLHAGKAAHVRVNPGDSDLTPSAKRTSPQGTPGAFAQLPCVEIEVEEEEEILAFLFRPHDQGEECVLPPQPFTHFRRIDLLTNDQIHLRSAISLLGLEIG